MPRISEQNLYAGVNPHLNSALQARGGGWKSFHTAHVMHIFEALDSTLPENYYAVPESSLQIGTYDAETTYPSSGTIADILVSRVGEGHTQFSPGGTSSVPTLQLPIPQLTLEDEELSGLVIYHVESGRSTGKPVTRIEVLSPANKPPGSHYGTYLFKRNQTLYSGLRLVEIDYLHERRPVVDVIPSYVDHVKDAFPYLIVVSDPRPSIIEGKMDIYGFGVLDKIPRINIPLDDDDVIPLDFGELYNQTFSKRPFQRQVDYSLEPINFGAYSEADQQQIRAYMSKLNKQ